MLTIPTLHGKDGNCISSYPFMYNNYTNVIIVRLNKLFQAYWIEYCKYVNTRLCLNVHTSKLVT